MTRRVAAALTILVTLAPATASAQSREERRREQLQERLAKKLGVPVEDLAAVSGERYAARDAATRRALLADLGQRPRGTLVPLVVDAALEDADFENRRAAVRLLSVVGLEADRALVLGSILPALPRLFADKSELIWQDAADELNRLLGWFNTDAEVAPLLERCFKGPNLRLAQRAFQGLLLLENPELRREVVLRAIVEVLHPKTRFGVFDRKRAVQAVPDHREAATPQALAATLHEDGTIAVEIAQVLGRLGDPSVLPALRRVDRTASHKLRLPAYEARGRLGDEALLAELVPALESDHVNVQLAIVEALAGVADPRVDQALARLAHTVTDAALRRAVALTRLRRGDAADLDLLRQAVAGADGDAALARRLLDVEHAAATPLVLAIAGNAAGPMAGPRARAVDLLGERGLDGEEARALLKKLQEGDPSALELRAAASLFQLDAADEALVEKALADLDVVSREDVATGAGTARRFSGSPLLEVMTRWARARTTRAAPLLARWLDPPSPAEPAAPRPATGDEGTSTRRDAAPAPRTPPAPPAWLAHQLVRRGAVVALGELAVALSETVAAGHTDGVRPGERSEAGHTDGRAALQADLDRAVAALACRMEDPAGVVRNAAVRALARVSGQDALAPGAPLAAEEEVRERLRRWVAARAR